jgi:hypothetical protein
LRRFGGGGLRGGGAGWSAASTGLGAKVGGSTAKVCSERSPGGVTCTATVCGKNPGIEKVTDWLVSGNARAHGVRQTWPCAVRASAPGGSDSNRSVCIGGGGGLMVSQSGSDDGELVHPASTSAHDAAMIRTPNMIASVRSIKPRTTLWLGKERPQHQAEKTVGGKPLDIRAAIGAALRSPHSQNALEKQTLACWAQRSNTLFADAARRGR